MSEEVATEKPIPNEPEPADARERLIQIRCGFAELAQLEAEAASDRAAEARRLHDEQAAKLVRVQAEVDPGLTQAAKDGAHKVFRAAIAAAQTRGHVEAAAAAWLSEINRINGQSRLALARIEHEHAVADALQRQLTKLSDTAEATAAMAAAAAEACRAAMATSDSAGPVGAAGRGEAAAGAAAAGAGPAQAAPTGGPPGDGAWTPEVAKLAARAARRKAAATTSGAATGPTAAVVASTAPSAAAPTGPPAAAQPGSGPSSADDDPLASGWLVIDLGAPRPQAIVKLVRRDGNAMSALVDRLCGGDPTARYDWQVQLSNLVDSIVAAAIEEGWFEFDPGNPFWDQFRAAESREIARGLAALGFRYDGFGAFVDDRVPTSRDLALAIGQAGLLPVKIRYWPSAEEATRLFAGVHVSADRFLATRAPALTLGEMVRLLGRRSELLADLWNNWPRCRPLLFSTAF